MRTNLPVIAAILLLCTSIAHAQSSPREALVGEFIGAHRLIRNSPGDLHVEANRITFTDGRVINTEFVSVEHSAFTEPPYPDPPPHLRNRDGVWMEVRRVTAQSDTLCNFGQPTTMIMLQYDYPVSSMDVAAITTDRDGNPEVCGMVSYYLPSTQ